MKFTKKEVLAMIQEAINSANEEAEKSLESGNSKRWQTWNEVGGGASYTYGYVKSAMEAMEEQWKGNY